MCSQAAFLPQHQVFVLWYSGTCRSSSPAANVMQDLQLLHDSGARVIWPAGFGPGSRQALPAAAAAGGTTNRNRRGVPVTLGHDDDANFTSTANYRVLPGSVVCGAGFLQASNVQESPSAEVMEDLMLLHRGGEPVIWPEGCRPSCARHSESRVASAGDRRLHCG